MLPKRLLIANRGEIAVRIAHAAADLGISTVALYSEDDAASRHTRSADEAQALHGRGPSAYLDAQQILGLARQTGCDAIHPGYGFLSESAEFARRVRAAQLTFVGPSTGQLELFGDEIKARNLARHCQVPLIPGSLAPASLAEAEQFLANLGSQGAILLKPAVGGAGRGTRVVRAGEDLASASRAARPRPSWHLAVTSSTSSNGSPRYVTSRCS